MIVQGLKPWKSLGYPATDNDPVYTRSIHRQVFLTSHALVIARTLWSMVNGYHSHRSSGVVDYYGHQFTTRWLLWATSCYETVRHGLFMTLFIPFIRFSFFPQENLLVHSTTG